MIIKHKRRIIIIWDWEYKWGWVMHVNCIQVGWFKEYFILYITMYALVPDEDD